MVGARKRKRIEDEKIGLVYRRRRRREKELELKASGSRFPKLADGSPAKGFATLSHSNLKSWAQVRKAQGHNTRAIDTPNARDDAPAPIELLEDQTGPYVDRIKAVLVAHDVPVRIRKNGTIATEDVLGASPEYWNRDGDWKEKSVDDLVSDPVVQAALAYARKKHGKRLISCSLHLDEESPHIHVVAVPLVFREHAVRGPRPKDCELDAKGKRIDYRPKVAKWTLDVSKERGLSSQLERNHDEWAEACKHIGLVRGERGSDMSLEERRARRAEQDGRASMKAKAEREERDALRREAIAEADGIIAEARHKGRSVAEEIMFQATEKAHEVEKQLEVRVRAVDARERALDIRSENLDVMAAQVEAAQEQARTAKLALEEAEHVQAQRQAANSHMSNLLREFDARTSAKKQELDKKAAKLIAAEVSFETSEKHLKDAIEFITEASRQGGHRLIDVVGGSLRPKTDDEHLPSWWKELSDDVRSLLGQGLKAIWKNAQEADVLKRERAGLAEEHQAISKLKSDLSRESGDLDLAWQEYEKAKAALKSACARAVAFHEAWKGIPDDERSPKVRDAISRAEGLTLDDVPLGFPLTGRGGRRGR